MNFRWCVNMLGFCSDSHKYDYHESLLHYKSKTKINNSMLFALHAA